MKESQAQDWESVTEEIRFRYLHGGFVSRKGGVISPSSYSLNLALYETRNVQYSGQELPTVKPQVLMRYMNDLAPKLDYLGPTDRALILLALELAHAAHDGQTRRSGEPFIIHPVAVAAILAELKVDRDTVISGLLHDTVEDTTVTFETIEALFGKDVRRIVEGETKFSKLASKIGASLSQTDTETDKKRSFQNAKSTSSKKDSVDSDTKDFDVSPSTSSASEDRQVEYLRRMFLAMTEDVRVILVKLADRLHNMRTLQFMKAEKQLKIARETIEIFAPLAHRLGLGKIRCELEDLSFRYLNPNDYYWMASELANFKGRTRIEYYLDRASLCLQHLLERDMVLSPLIQKLDIKSFIKPTYTVFKKLQGGTDLDSICDLVTLRIVIELKQDVVNSWNTEEDCYGEVRRKRNPTGQWNWLEILKKSQSFEEDCAKINTAPLYERNVCYHILGRVHSLWKPIPGKMKDYIAFPKPNGYQSLHTIVLLDTKNGSFPLEIQIRTQSMHEISELGITSRFFLDTNLEGEIPRIDWRRRTIAWLRSLREYCDEFSYSSRDLIEAIRGDLLGNRIFVFTPKGYILDLPKGSTPIDAAYHIHSDLGSKMIGARVNGRFVSLDYTLQNADVIKIIKSESGRPSADWINMARSRTARQKIRRFLRQKERQSLIQKGRKDWENLCEEMNVSCPSNSEIMNGLYKLLNLLKMRITLRTKQYNYPTALVQWLESLKSSDDFYASVSKYLDMPSREGWLNWVKLIIRFIEIRNVVPNKTSTNIDKTIDQANDCVQVAPTNKTNETADFSYKNSGKADGMRLVLARCCLPVAGDDVTGILYNRDTILVHCKDCRMMVEANQYSYFVNLSWKEEAQLGCQKGHQVAVPKSTFLFPARLTIKAKDTVGLLSGIAGIISEQGYSITRSTSSCESGMGLAVLSFEILVSHVKDIESLCSQLQKCRGIVDVKRTGDLNCLEWCSSTISSSQEMLTVTELLVIREYMMK
eukprot:jgi/Galph1/124/GphlegSOOS_G4842.1